MRRRMTSRRDWKLKSAVWVIFVSTSKKTEVNREYTVPLLKCLSQHRWHSLSMCAANGKIVWYEIGQAVLKDAAVRLKPGLSPQYATHDTNE